MKTDVVIVGAGLAGLTCARVLAAGGAAVQVLEAGDGVGGRVRSDRVDGFVLDRGFQVFLTHYPEARRLLDLDALDLCAFEPGARVWTGEGFSVIGDPFRDPSRLFETLRADVGSLFDKLRILKLRQRSLSGPETTPFERAERSTVAELKALGFSSRVIERFFRPFLGGVFLDGRLETSNRMLYFTWRHFAGGDVAVPAGGMGRIPAQLAAGLPAGTVRLGARVAQVHHDRVVLDDGEQVFGLPVVATDGGSAAKLLGVEARRGQDTTCVWYAADDAPLASRHLMLDGTGRGPVNHMALMSEVAPAYAPAGQALLSVNVLGTPDADDEALDGAIRAQLTEWLGGAVAGWRRLAVQRIRDALPAQPPGVLDPPERPLTMGGIHVCGDHRHNGSINGAMASGRRIAEALLAR